MRTPEGSPGVSTDSEGPAGYPRGAAPPAQRARQPGSLATSCHLLGVFSHRLCFVLIESSGSFTSPSFLPAPSFASVSVFLSGIRGGEGDYGWVGWFSNITRNLPQTMEMSEPCEPAASSQSFRTGPNH